MRLSDGVGAVYLGAITAFIVFQNELFIRLTETYPYPMGVAKIALLVPFRCRRCPSDLCESLIGFGQSILRA